ncbi:tafazzin-like [Mercenaria mercenaria]|uniref:tafazzin-like n=1 Tax=Mercenaria mercenaria TaxID=6596 RepID=UPI00234F5720|nr:tafazzin-like [Mercenaria mercenaria]
MENMYPTKKPYYPRVGKKITVVIGEPLDFEDLRQLREQRKSEEEVRKCITDKIQNVFASLKAETEMRHKEQTMDK